MKNLAIKIFSCCVLVIILLFVLFIGSLFLSFGGNGKFYIPMLIVFISMIAVYGIVLIFKLVKLKILNTVGGCLLVICVLITTGYTVYRKYEKSIPTVSEQGVNLKEYMPFLENTKAVGLENPSKFKISGNLPKLDGATALYPLYSAFAKSAYPNMEYNINKSEVRCNNTVGAYQSLIKGEVDIIFAARPSKEQLDNAKKSGKELVLTPIGYEAFVFFVNSKNNISDLTTSQIQDIYSGKITNWKEVGGKNDKIRAFQRPENSGSQTMLQNMMKEKTLMVPPKEDVVAGMGGIIEQTSSYKNYKNAIGYSFLFFATEMIKNDQIRLLKVDGVSPERSTIKSKAYPLVGEFYAITAGSTNKNNSLLIDWILSVEGQQIVEKTGYTPIK